MSYFSLGHRLGTALDIILHQFTPISIIFTFAFSFCITQASHCIIQMQICREFMQRGQSALCVCTCECYMLASLTFLACYGTHRIRMPCVISCVFVCVWWHVRVHASWLTSHKKQGQNQAAQGQREGGREKAAQDSAPNSPHCVLKSRVYMCDVCVGVFVWMCTFDQSLLCDHAAIQPNESTYTHAHTELICSQQQRCRHVHTVTAQLYFSAIRQKLLFRGNLQNKLLCATWNTWKRSCFGSKITQISMQNTEVWPRLIVLSQCTQKWALGHKKLVNWLSHLRLLRENLSNLWH